MTTSSTPDRGRALLMSSAAASFVLSAALVAGPALAANECGTQSGATVTCPGNSTFSSITYLPTTDLTVVTQSTDTVNGPITVTGSGAANVGVTNAAPVTTTTANSPGIYATATGSGSVNVTSTGDITTTGTSTNGGTIGANSDGVVAVATGSGSTTVNVTNVSATGTNSWGVLAENTGSGPVTVTVAQGGTVVASGNGVAMLAGPTSTETLNNNGTITGGAGAYSVITAAGGAPATINNYASGTLNGPISLNGGVAGSTVSNIVNNSGNWNVSGTSTFGAANTTNTVYNTGTITTVTAAGATSPGTAYFANLATLNNAGGTIDLTSGNSLNIGNAAFNGGNNSNLRINANSQSGVLTVGSTPNGQTNVVLADIPKTNPAMNLQGATIVTGPAGTAGGPSNGSFAFTGGAADQQEGFVDYRLVFNGAGTNTPSNYELFGLPGPAVFEALNIPYALQDFWRHSADPLTQRQMSIRDSQVGETPTRAEGWEFWAIPYGGSDFFKRPQTFQFGGFNFPGVGNHSDTIGLQIGADMLTHFGGGDSGPLSHVPGLGFLGIGGAGTGYWGFTGGVEQQTTHFPGDDANDIYSVGGNFGIYGGASWGGFYLNALGKVDFDDMNTNFFTAGNFSPTNMFKAYGTRGEIGYRWPWAGFFVEPSARVNAIWIDGIDLNPAGALLHFNSGNASVDGEVGGRVGFNVNFGKWMPGPVGQFNPFPGSVEAYVGAWWADQWDGQNLMSFTTFGGINGPTTIGLAQPTMGNFIHMEYGLETADWYGGLKLFLKGENNFSGDSVGGWSALAGVRFTF